jgi:hypothetical protein
MFADFGRPSRIHYSKFLSTLESCIVIILSLVRYGKNLDQIEKQYTRVSHS